MGRELAWELGVRRLEGLMCEEQDWDGIAKQLYHAITAELPAEISDQ